MFCNSITEKLERHFKRKINTCMTFVTQRKKLQLIRACKKFIFPYLLNMTNPHNFICIFNSINDKNVFKRI